MENIKIRSVVLSFALEMEKKLAANRHKGGWRHGTDFEYLIKRLREEVDELELAVANFAMMIADNINNIEE